MKKKLEHLKTFEKYYFTDDNYTKQVFIDFVATYKFNYKGKKYNDISVTDKQKEGILSWSSGFNGSFRPEGYAFGSEESSKKIKNRVKKLVDDFNKKYKGDIKAEVLDNREIKITKIDDK